VESIWEIARREWLRVAARSELTWWRQLFPHGFDDYVVLPRAAAYLAPPPGPGVTLVHPVYVDEAGHDHGAASAEYRAQVARLDGELESFLDGVDLGEDLVVLTADHGHTDRGGHGGRSPEVAWVLTCFAGRGVARLADAGPMTSREVAPALAVLLGLPFPRHMRASPLAGDDGLDRIFEIVDAAAFPAAYLADRRAAVGRFRDANPPWAEIYAEGRDAQGLKLGLIAALLVLILGGPSVALWAAATVALAVALHLRMFDGFDASTINQRGPYLRVGGAMWLAVASGSFALRWLSTRDLRRAVADQMRLVAAGVLVCLGLVWMFGWPLGFPLPSARMYFLPFFATIGTAALALVLGGGSLLLTLRRGWLALAAAAALAGCSDASTADARTQPPVFACDPVGQNCPDGGAPKCSVLLVDNVAVARCLPLEGSVAEGETCERSEGIGRDDCAAGGYCSGIGYPLIPEMPRTRVCRRFCHAVSDCVQGDACVKVTEQVPPDGICVPTGCALFDASCDQGMTCDALAITVTGQWAGVCRSPGPQRAGEDCSAADCVAGAHCAAGTTPGTATCHALCDDTHHCPESQRCSPYEGLPNGAGRCP